MGASKGMLLRRMMKTRDGKKKMTQQLSFSDEME